MEAWVKWTHCKKDEMIPRLVLCKGHGLLYIKCPTYLTQTQENIHNHSGSLTCTLWTVLVGIVSPEATSSQNHLMPFGFSLLWKFRCGYKIEIQFLFTILHTHSCTLYPYVIHIIKKETPPWFTFYALLPSECMNVILILCDLIFPVFPPSVDLWWKSSWCQIEGDSYVNFI